MKKTIILLLWMVLCFLMLLLMIKRLDKSITYHHSGLDSAVVYASYHREGAKRIAFPPSFLTSFLQKDDSGLSGYHCEPSDTTGFYEFYQSLPAMLKEMLDQKLIGIYFYENLSADGLFHTVYSSNDRYYVVACDRRILNRDLSGYFTEKENSRFMPSGYRINVNVDTVFNAFFYVLLHEFFHIFEVEHTITSLFDEAGRYSGIQSSFVTNYWQFPTVPKDSIFNSLYAIGNLYNKDYNRLIESCFVIPIYTELSKGNFASYYSTLKFQEDVVEYLTLYYLTQRLNSTYEIVVRKGDELLLGFRPFENRKLLERFNNFPQNIQLSLSN